MYARSGTGHEESCDEFNSTSTLRNTTPVVETVDGDDQATNLSRSPGLWSNMRDTEEKPSGKVHRRTFRLAMVVHMLSVSMTVALFVVYVKGVAWNPGATEINALLIASKVYESLITASLS